MKQLRTLLEDKGFYRISLNKLNTGHYQVFGNINDKSGTFIVDTGASTSCLGFESAAHFNLNIEASTILAAGAGATNMLTKIARNNVLSFGIWQVKKIDFVLFDLTHVNEALLQTNEKAVHGIIGADFLKQHRAVIDYGRNCMYVFK